jgi:hypothetical protein
MCPVQCVTYVSGRSSITRARSFTPPLPIQDLDFRSWLLCYFGSSIQMLPVVSAYSYTMDLPSGAQSG